MPLRALNSLAYDDEELYDKARQMAEGPGNSEPPEYPPGMCFSITMEDLAQAGVTKGVIGQSMRFSAMCTVTSMFAGKDDCRVELEMDEFAGDDGKFNPLTQPAHLCLCGPEMEKMDLDVDCERGDTLHLIGTIRLESMASTEWGGDTATFQVTDASYEDESQESRAG